MSMPDSQSGLSASDLFAITGASALTSAAVSGALDNSRRDSFGSIVTGLSAPIVASVAEKEPAPVAAPVVTPAPLADMSKFQVSQL